MMKTISPSPWLKELPPYPFVELRSKKESLKKRGVNVIDFSIGDPAAPTPDFILEKTSELMKNFQSSGYPDNIGLPEFRKAVSRWQKKRFGIELNWENEIFPSLGAKEAVFAFPNACDGGAVLVPTPGYPPYFSGARAAGKKVHLYPLLPENRFLPDLQSIREEHAKEAVIMWINYPNNPTTVHAPDSFYEEVIEFGKKYNIIIASDECYSEMYQTEAPKSILQFAKEGAIAFQSLSKRSNMTGWRVGYMAGDKEIIKTFLTAKENMDSGCCNFLQMAAAAALEDEDHVISMRNDYNRKREIITEALADRGFKKGYSDGTFYIWQPVPEGMKSEELALRLLEEDTAIVVTPGPALAHSLPDGTNPGEGFVRFALVPTVEQTIEAAERLKKAL